MPANIVFLNPSGSPASLLDRKTKCISFSNLQAGTIATLSVTVKNTGDATAGLCTAQFFLKRPADSIPIAIPSNLTSPANPLPPAPLQPGASTTLTLQWTVQSADVGAGMLFAQIQTQSPPPQIDPSNMALPINTQRIANVLSAGVSFAAAKDMDAAVESAPLGV